MLTKWIWEWLGLIVFLVAMLTGQFGCAVIIEDEGEVEFTFGTTIGIKSSSSTTHSESRATIESQAFEDWFKARAGGDGATDGEDKPVDGGTGGATNDGDETGGEGEEEVDVTKVP